MTLFARPGKFPALSAALLSSTALGAAAPSVFIVAPSGIPAAGPTFGCNDRLVEVALGTPSKTPLRAALTALLTFKPSDSKLLNPLQGSTLRVEAITLKSQSAVIALSGKLMLNGACDAPRIMTQLWETATQFPTVRQACFFLNGRPLEEALDASGRTFAKDICTRTLRRTP